MIAHQLNLLWSAAFKRFRVPSSLDMRDGTRLKVQVQGEGFKTGSFRGAAPDGSYAVLLDDGRLMAFSDVQLA